MYVDITCPSCKAVHAINHLLLLTIEEGRNLKCGSCKHVFWQAYSEDLPESKLMEDDMGNVYEDDHAWEFNDAFADAAYQKKKLDKGPINML